MNRPTKLLAAMTAVAALSATSCGSTSTPVVVTVTETSHVSIAQHHTTSKTRTTTAPPVDNPVAQTAPVSPSGNTGDTAAPPDSTAGSTTPTPARSTTSAPVAAPTVTMSPEPGSTDLSPTDPVDVVVDNGTITTLTMTNPNGKKVAGEFSNDRSHWATAEPLGYGKTYTITGKAIGADGSTVPIDGTLSTLTPERLVTSTISPGEGATVGVAFPVMIKFSEGLDATVRARIARRVHITTTPKVQGAWAWVRHDDQRWGLDYRPKEFWPAGTKVHVEADLYGVDMGDGGYGATDLTRDFTIGRNQVVYANAKSYEIVVKRDGKTIATYPASYGNGDLIGDPNRVTRSGIHVVSAKYPVYKMSNPKYGYTDITEYWDVRISSNGEFIHQNMDSYAAQGNTNVSHGCINLSDVSAKAYFSSAMIGDPVIVTGTSIQLSQADGDIYDWTIPWKKWATGTASK